MVGYNDYNGGVAAGIFFLVYGILFLVAIAAYVISAIFYNKLFEKAGVQGKWRGWVPVYRELVFAKLGDVNPWAVLILYGAAIVLGWIPVIGQLIGVAAFVLLVLAAYRIGQKLQKEGAWVVLYILLSLVWLGIVAFDKSRWQPVIGPAPWASTGVLVDKTVWQGVPVQPSAVGSAVRDDFGPPPPAGSYPPPAGYTPPPPAGYSPPPPGGYSSPPSGYTPPPTTQPPAPEEPPRA